MNMVEKLRLFICLLLLLFTGCSSLPNKEQIEAFRAVRTVRLIVENRLIVKKHWTIVEKNGANDFVIDDIKRTIVHFFTHAKIKVLGINAEKYDATVRIKVKRQALGATYKDKYGINFQSYSGAKIFGNISFEKTGIGAYKEDFRGERSPPSMISRKYSKPDSAPFALAFRYSDFKTKLGKMIGQIYGVEVLIDALKDKDSDVREVAAKTLDKLRWKPTTDNEAIVYYYIAKGDWEECGKIGRSAVDPLVGALKHEDWNVRNSAAKALGEIGDQRAVEPLIDALKDKKPPVREAAEKALDKIKTKRR